MKKRHGAEFCFYINSSKKLLGLEWDLDLTLGKNHSCETGPEAESSSNNKVNAFLGVNQEVLLMRWSVTWVPRDKGWREGYFCSGTDRVNHAQELKNLFWNILKFSFWGVSGEIAYLIQSMPGMCKFSHSVISMNGSSNIIGTMLHL